MKLWPDAVRARLPYFAAALWWGSLSAVGAMVVPQLFARLPTPAMAGNLAAQLFTAQTWLSLACGLGLLAVCRGAARDDPNGSEAAALRWVVTGLLFAVLAEFGVAPRIVARENLPLWHSLGMTFYAMQWISAGAVMWRLWRPRATQV